MKPIPLLLAAFLALSAVACGPRKVHVVSGAQAVSEVTLAVTNNLDQEVSVYVLYGGNETFLKRVAANSTERFNVPNIASGTSVTLRAVPVNGGDSYTRSNVVLSGMYEWEVP